MVDSSARVDFVQPHSRRHRMRQSCRNLCHDIAYFFKNFFNNIRGYLVVSTVVYLLVVAIQTYWSPLVDSVEKEFRWTSAQFGFLPTAMDIGSIPFLILVSYFGSRWHVPRVIGLALTVMPCFAVCLTIPHFMFQQQALDIIDSNTHDNTSNSSYGDFCMEGPDNSTAPSYPGNLHTSSNIAFGIYLVVFCLMGVCTTPLGTLTLAYLDNNGDKAKTPMLLGLMNGAIALGPLVGTYLAAWCQSIFFTLGETNLTPKSPTWIGAWWLGLLIICALWIPAAPLFCFFPRSMKLEETPTINIQVDYSAGTDSSTDRDTVYSSQSCKTEQEFITAQKKTYTLKNLPRSLKRLLTNPVFMLLVASYVCVSYIYGGMRMFIYKYFEDEFSVPAWKMATITGTTSTVSTLIGSTISGFLITKLKLSYSQATLMIIGNVVVTTAFYVAKMFMRCERRDIAGIVPGRPDQDLLMPCNAGCGCDTSLYNPVCDSGVTYFSQCYAGCVGSTFEGGNSTSTVFYGCNCTMSHLATPGSCQGECVMAYWYVALDTISSLLAAITSTARIVMFLRCVNDDDKALAMGFSTFLIALVGSLPASPLFGTVIDSSCLVWQEIDGERGNCWIYNREELRLRLHGFSLVFYGVDLILLFIILIISRQKNFDMGYEPTTKDYQVLAEESDDDGADGEVNQRNTSPNIAI